MSDLTNIRESKKRWVQNNKDKVKAYQHEYYLQHRESRKQPRECEIPKDIESFIHKWNGELSRRMEENASEWLEIALKRQIEINDQYLEEQRTKKQDKPIKWLYAYKLDSKEFIRKFEKQVDASRFFGLQISKVGHAIACQSGRIPSQNLYFTYTKLHDDEQI